MKKCIIICLTAIFISLFALCLTASAATYGDLTYSVSNGKATITDCNESASGDIVIPSTLGRYPVTSIGSSAFYRCDSLTSVTIPDSVTSIGASAFRSCTSLTSVTIPDSVTSIYDHAFYGCSNLTDVYITDLEAWLNIDFGYLSNPFNYAGNLYINNKLATNITIPNTVTSIGSSAFYDCDSLTSVTIPNSVTSIGSSAFISCSNLTSVTIPNSVTSIGSSAFKRCDNLTSVTIPNSVTSIGSSAFYGCSGLTSVTIGNSVTSIGDSAFESCDSLTSINVAENNSSYCSINGVLFNKDKSVLIQYPAGKTEQSYIVPDSVTSIGDSAFYDCDSLISVTIPDSVTSIGESAFSGCSDLTSVTIPDSVTSIGDSAFAYCYALTSINVAENNSSYCSVDGVLFNKDKTELILSPGGKPEQSYTIPNSVTTIGDFAFTYCDSLTSVTIGSSVTTIADYAFYDCDSLTSVTIPNSVTSIGSSAFYDCESLTSVYITDLAAWCNIQFLSYSSNPLYYAENFYINGQLTTDIVIPDSITSIGDSAFAYCDSLTSVAIPDSVTSIGVSAFYNCDSLTDVYYIGTEEKWNEISISRDNSALTNANIIFCNILSYNPNGGVADISPEIFETGDVVTISEVVPTREGYTFLGWALTDSATKPVYQPGDSNLFYGNLTLYAVWKEITGYETETRSSIENGHIILYIKANEEIPVTKRLHIALYSENGRMLDYITVPTFEAFDKTNVVFSDNGNVSYAKIFLWENSECQTPTAMAEQVTIR